MRTLFLVVITQGAVILGIVLNMGFSDATFLQHLIGVLSGAVAMVPVVIESNE